MKYYVLKFLKIDQGLSQAANPAFFDKELVDKIKYIIDKVNDFDLTDIRSFRHRSDRFLKYLMRSLGMGNSLYPFCQVEFEKMGVPFEDRLYFLILKMQYDFPEGEEKDFWGSVAGYIHTGDFYRDRAIIKAINEAARVAANIPREMLFENYSNFTMHDCHVWLGIIDSQKTSQEVWESIFESKRENQFIKLITCGQFVFFHPYFPLSDEIRKDFKNALVYRIQEINQGNDFSFSTVQAPPDTLPPEWQLGRRPSPL